MNETRNNLENLAGVIELIKFWGFSAQFADEWSPLVRDGYFEACRDLRKSPAGPVGY
jgi:hypothetical protein